MNVFKHHSSSNTKKRKTTRSNNKQQHTSNSTTADTSNHHSPQQNSTPHHLEAGHRHRDHLERVKFTWVRSEGLEYGMFCGQSAQWDNTVYFRTGGSNEIFEYSCRCVGMYVCMCVCMYVHMYIHMCIRILYVCVCMYVCVHMYMCVYTYMCSSPVPII